MDTARPKAKKRRSRRMEAKIFEGRISRHEGEMVDGVEASPAAVWKGWLD